MQDVTEESGTDSGSESGDDDIESVRTEPRSNTNPNPNLHWKATQWQDQHQLHEAFLNSLRDQ